MARQRLNAPGRDLSRSSAPPARPPHPPSAAPGEAAVSLERPVLRPTTADLPVDFRVTLAREQDLLYLRFELINLVLAPNSQPPALVRKVAGQPAYVVAVFEPQGVAEQTFFEADPGVDNTNRNPGSPATPLASDALVPPPVASRVAGASRLAFRVPDGVPSLPFTAESLLSWGGLLPSLAPTARGSAPVEKPPITRPENVATAIEAPWRLFLSPDESGVWRHALAPVEHQHPVSKARWTELWHTRLGVAGAGGGPPGEAGGQARVRAIWATGFPATYKTSAPSMTDEAPFATRAALNDNDRYQIVRLTSDYSVGAVKPVTVNRLMLSALGAWLDVRGEWSPPGGLLTVEEWRHLATQGRDHYARVVYRGFLLPFGHRASLVKVTERRFQTVPSGQHAGRTAAYARQRTYLVVREPEKAFAAEGAPQAGHPHEGRGMPFKRVRLTTLVTPNLNKPADSQLLGSAGAKAFWPMVQVPQPGGGAAARDFQFHVVAFDQEGQRSEFAMPMAFVSGPVMTTPSGALSAQAVRAAYKAAAPNRVSADLEGQKVALARSSVARPGDTSLPAHTVVFELQEAGDGLPGGLPLSFPRLVKADVRLPAAEQALGALAGVTPPKLSIEYVPDYLIHGFSEAVNKAEVFARQAAGQAQSYAIGLTADKAGALATPAMAVKGLSRQLGPFGGPAQDLLAGKFDPASYFSAAGTLAPKLLGGIPLAAILKRFVPNAGLSALDSLPSTSLPQAVKDGRLPQITTTVKFPDLPDQPGVPDRTKPPQEVATRLFWAPNGPGDAVDEARQVVKSDPLGVFVPNADGKKTHLTIDSTLTQSLRTLPEGPPPAPTYSITGVLTDFKMRLLGSDLPLVVLTFERLTFTSRSGQKPDVDVDITRVEFDGDLAFVNALQDFLKLGKGMLDSLPSQAAPVVRGALPAAADDSRKGGLAVDVTPQGVRASLGLGLPSIAVGIFALQSIALGAALHIPFNGDPARLRFNFASPDSPFRLTVAFFSGGGFFEVELGLDGIESLRLNLQFGASLAIDLGVASGGVHALGGLDIQMLAGPPESAKLTGYLTLGGELDVLGLISLSVEFSLSLAYDDTTGEAWGRATVTVEVEVLFFSTEVSMTVERRFAGGRKGQAALGAAGRGGLDAPGQPIGFRSLVPVPQDWARYCQAFAA